MSFKGARPASRGNGPENRCPTQWDPGCKSLVLRHFIPPLFNARMVQQQHIRLSTGKPRGSTGCGCHFPHSTRLIAQKQSSRLTSGRQRSITVSGDHFPSRFLRSSKAELPPDKRKTTARYRAEGPSSLNGRGSPCGRLKAGISRCDSGFSDHFPCVIGVTAARHPSKLIAPGRNRHDAPSFKFKAPEV